jgi:hypothetical protein
VLPTCWPVLAWSATKLAYPVPPGWWPSSRNAGRVVAHSDVVVVGLDRHGHYPCPAGSAASAPGSGNAEAGRRVDDHGPKRDPAQRGPARPGGSSR